MLKFKNRHIYYITNYILGIGGKIEEKITAILSICYKKRGSPEKSTFKSGKAVV